MILSGTMNWMSFQLNGLITGYLPSFQKNHYKAHPVSTLRTKATSKCYSGVATEVRHKKQNPSFMFININCLPNTCGNFPENLEDTPLLQLTPLMITKFFRYPGSLPNRFDSMKDPFNCNFIGWLPKFPLHQFNPRQGSAPGRC